MGLRQTVSSFFGTAPAQLLDGFTRSERGVRLPVCRRCGALVAYETQRTHVDWHRSG